MTVKQQKLWDYFIFCARVLLAFTLLRYGWSKMTGNQFGISPEELLTPVKDLSLFQLSWYFFSHEPFNSFVGISQIIAGLLLLFNRTALLGALIAVPILANILVIDITYLQMPAFYWRLAYYLVLDFLIFWHYRDRIVTAFKALFVGLTTKFRYPLWAYLILPVMVVGLEVLSAVPRLLTELILYPEQTISDFSQIPRLIAEFMNMGNE